MQRKADVQGLDVPKDDIESWEKYPKHRWVYEISRLFDAQNIKWSPYQTESCPDRELSIELVSDKSLVRQPGFIWTKKPSADKIITEVHIIKGEIKNIRHFDLSDNELSSIIGDIELRINAFVTLHFQKFTGVISTDTYAHEIFRIRLRPHISTSLEANGDIAKLTKRIYKRTDVTLSGPTDRALHETLVS